MMGPRMKTLVYPLALVVVAMAANAEAVPKIDGMASIADGYTLLSTQNTDTQFGNATNPDLLASGGGSEIDQVFGKIEGGRFYMVVAGNLEMNFNKLQLFIDSVAGGVNQINGDEFTPEDNNVPFGLDAFCCGGFEPPNGDNTDNIGALQRMDGMTFDTGFEADYALIFTHGGESVGAVNPTEFWAMSAHYADLTQGTDGAVVAAGIQLAPIGLPNVLRFPFNSDFDNNSKADGNDFLIWQQNVGALGNATRETGDANDDMNVDALDVGEWQSEFGTTRSLADLPYKPSTTTPPTTALIGPVLPGLGQGELIDKNYALGTDGGCTGDTTDGNAGCVARELEFVLPVDTNDAGNTLNHRDFDNTVDLMLAINNSNNAGVNGSQGPDFSNTGDPENVRTGVEFSIPLSEIGNPAALSDVKITAFVNGSSHDFASNQFAGEGILQGNLGGFEFLDLGTIDGDQFVTLSVPVVAAAVVVPEPSSFAIILAGMMACGLLTRRLI